jgi:hypothetical protein
MAESKISPVASSTLADYLQPVLIRTYVPVLFTKTCGYTFCRLFDINFVTLRDIHEDVRRWNEDRSATPPVLRIPGETSPLPCDDTRLTHLVGQNRLSCVYPLPERTCYHLLFEDEHAHRH